MKTSACSLIIRVLDHAMRIPGDEVGLNWGTKERHVQLTYTLRTNDDFGLDKTLSRTMRRSPLAHVMWDGFAFRWREIAALVKSKDADGWERRILLEYVDADGYRLHPPRIFGPTATEIPRT